MQYFNGQNSLKLAAICALAIGCAGVSVDSRADTNTANLTVSATVVANCLISTSPVAFGEYDPISVNAAAAIDVTGAVLTTCTTGSSPTITLGDGANYDAGRRMVNGGTNYLSYELYTTNARDTVWSSTGVATPAPDGTQKSNTVYGRLPGGQNMPVGAYTDTVLATVTF